MAIPTREALSGFIVSDPQLTTSENGRQRFYARIGIEQSERGADGTYTELEPLFTDLVMFDKSAERAFAQFQKGDHFIADGRSLTRDYQGKPRDQFIASRIGHDNNLTTYTVDRSRRERHTPAQDSPDRESAERDPAAAALAQREQDLTPTTEAAGPVGAAPGIAVAR